MKLPGLDSTALRVALGLGGAGSLDAYTKGVLGGVPPAAFGAFAPPGHPVFANAGMLDRLLRLPAAAYRAASTDSTFAKLADTFRWLEVGYAHWEVFAVEWANDPLWLMLSVLDYVLTSRLFGLARAEVEVAVLTALTEVVLEGRLISAMRAAVAKVPHLNRFQRQLLDEGLVAAAAGRWVRAVLPLTVGLEGLLQSLAAERSAMLRQRRGKIAAAPKIIEFIDPDPDPDFSNLLCRYVFGGRGQEFRHGLAEDGEREQALLALLGLAYCLECWLEIRAMTALTRLFTARLADVIDRRDGDPPGVPE
jgi:hypothetical protein